ncbi:hypothetical protein ACIRON_10830 [Nocardioides sp. NPDC101246]|uniref:hypothetical protein n=1 Tax=Nocardioides sp. NPDC101246 TaxID=3364336 RepID=UPI0038262BD9
MSGSDDRENVYNEPMFFGDFNGQMSMGNRESVQYQVNQASEPDIATVVAEVLKKLGALGLPEDDLNDAVVEGKAVLAEVAKEEPDRTVVRRGINYLKGAVAGIAAGVATGANQGAAEIGQQIVRDLGSLII